MRVGRAALPRLTKLAATNPDAPVFQTTYARALKEAGQIGARRSRSTAAPRSAGRPTRCCCTISRSPRERRRPRRRARPRSALRDEAVRADQAALTLAPNSAMAHNGLGLLAVDADRPQDAVKEFERAAAIDPNNASYWANLGNARRAVGDRAGAEQAYRRALDVDARAADAANGLGVLLVEAKRPAEAIPWFERAIAAAPDFVEARLNLGIALQQSGQTARAADDLPARCWPRRGATRASATRRRSCSPRSEPLDEAVSG